MNEKTNKENINIDEVILYKKRELSEKGQKMKDGSYKKVPTFLISIFLSIFLLVTLMLTGVFPSQWFELFRIEGFFISIFTLLTFSHLLKIIVEKMADKEYITYYYCGINGENFEITKEEYETFETIKNIKKLQKQNEIKQKLFNLYEKEVLKK